MGYYSVFVWVIVLQITVHKKRFILSRHTRVHQLANGNNKERQTEWERQDTINSGHREVTSYV